MKNALIIVNMQYDFIDGGSMAHFNSLEIIAIINRIRENFNLIIFIKECHPNNHCSFKKYGGIYPEHAIENTIGYEIHNDLIKEPNDIIIHIGTLQKYDSYSGFFDAESIEKNTNLKHVLKINEINKLYFCGNGIDRNIFSTIIDAINFKFECIVIKNAITYYDKQQAIKCIEYLEKNDVKFVDIDDKWIPIEI